MSVTKEIMDYQKSLINDYVDLQLLEKDESKTIKAFIKDFVIYCYKKQSNTAYPFRK